MFAEDGLESLGGLPWLAEMDTPMSTSSLVDTVVDAADPALEVFSVDVSTVVIVYTSSYNSTLAMICVKINNSPPGFTEPDRNT